MTGTRLVAGIGFRRGTPSDAIVALIVRALSDAGLGGRLVAIATAADRAAEAAIRDAAAAFGLVPLPVEAAALERVDPRVPTRSARIARLRGVGSLAEAAALAVAGDAGRLVLARIDDGRATCALAATGRDATDDRPAGATIPTRPGSLFPARDGRDDGRSGEVSSLTLSRSRAGCRLRTSGDGFERRALPSPLCGGGWPAKRVGRGERRFRITCSPLPTLADARATLPPTQAGLARFGSPMCTSRASPRCVGGREGALVAPPRCLNTIARMGEETGASSVQRKPNTSSAPGVTSSAQIAASSP